MVKHKNAAHRGQEPVYRAKVTASTRDCLTRQVREAVMIRRSQVPVLNAKTEWHQPALYRIQHEVERGWEYVMCGPSLGQTEQENFCCSMIMNIYVCWVISYWYWCIVNFSVFQHINYQKWSGRKPKLVFPNMQIKPFMLLSFLMIVATLVHTKVQTTEYTIYITILRGLNSRDEIVTNVSVNYKLWSNSVLSI